MKITLADITRQKRQMLKDIRMQKSKLQLSDKSLYAPKETYSITNYFNLFENLILGYNLFRSIRRLFRKR